jgi:uncharacterized protein YndB with AHSA1/START domain
MEDLMADILLMVPIEAPLEVVYRAISEPEGLSKWWTTSVEGTGDIGETLIFRFEGGGVEMRMGVESLEAPKSIRWRVEEPPPPEWEGTEVTWDLEVKEGMTHLLFGHRNWQSTEGSFPSINYSWAYYLTSLKEYVEKGEGFPQRN